MVPCPYPTSPLLPMARAVSRYLLRSRELTSWGLQPRDLWGSCKRRRRSKSVKCEMSIWKSGWIRGNKPPGWRRRFGLYSLHVFRKYYGRPLEEEGAEVEKRKHSPTGVEGSRRSRGGMVTRLLMWPATRAHATAWN